MIKRYSIVKKLIYLCYRTIGYSKIRPILLFKDIALNRIPFIRQKYITVVLVN